MCKAIGVSLGLFLLCGGCASVPIQGLTAPENSMCQELLAESVKRNLEGFDLAPFRGKRVQVTVAQAAGEGAILNAAYVHQLLTRKLCGLGAVVVSDSAQADVNLVCTLDVAGLQATSASFLPGFLFYVLPLVHSKAVTARVSSELFTYSSKGQPGAVETQSAPPKETSYEQLYILGLGPMRSSR